jgi:ATP-dependent Lon protease
MTGEITLRGRILPIGGLREKLLAAVRAGMEEVVIPVGNEPDLSEVPAVLKSKLKIHLVKQLEEGLEVALVGFKIRRKAERKKPRTAEVGLA